MRLWARLALMLASVALLSVAVVGGLSSRIASQQAMADSQDDLRREAHLHAEVIGRWLADQQAQSRPRAIGGPQRGGVGPRGDRGGSRKEEVREYRRQAVLPRQESRDRTLVPEGDVRVRRLCRVGMIQERRP